MATPKLTYRTSLHGHYVVLHTPTSATTETRTIVCEFPDDSPVFTPEGEWDARVLDALITVLVDQFNQTVMDGGPTRSTR